METSIPSKSESIIGGQSYLQEMMDIFSKATGLNAVVVDLDGNPFISSEDYNRIDYCQCIKNDVPGGCGRCRRTYREACKEAYRWDEPYYFVCHAGLVSWAIPLIMQGMPIGALICGQVLLWKVDDLFWDEMGPFYQQLSLPMQQKLQKEASRLKIISGNQCESSAKMLSVIARYIVNAYDATLLEQKSRQEWRNTILARLEEQKEEHKDEVFDLSVYLKRERRFLQALRMADAQKIKKLIPLLFTDIEMLSGHDVHQVCHMLQELVVLSSRALMEAGIESAAVMDLSSTYQNKALTYSRIEDLFSYTYQIFDQLLESVYLLIDTQEHTSVIKSVRKYIDDHYSEKIKMQDIAKSVSMSPSYLATLFKRKMNLSIHDYLLRVRIEKSIELMQNRELSIPEIIQECGIGSRSYYNKVFKKLIGLTPGKYRNQLL